MAETTFILLLVVTETLGIAAIGLMLGLLLGPLGGLSLSIEDDAMFNVHPLLMTIGFVFLYGNAILTFKVATFAGVDRNVRKLIHFAIQTVAFVIAVLGVVMAFWFNGVHGYPPLQSIHSWIGLATVTLFGLQLLFGFFYFLFPRPRECIREVYRAVHVYFGFFIFAMVAVAVLTGLTEHIMLNGSFDVMTPAGLLADLFAIALMAFICFVTFTTTVAGPTIPDRGEPSHTEEEGERLMETKQ